MKFLQALAKRFGFKIAKGSGIYIERELNCTSEAVLRSWAYAVGLYNVAWDKLHVTLVHSTKVIPWTLDPKSMDLALINPRLEQFDGGVVVLAFDCPELTARWQEAIDAGAQWSYEGFIPHITLALSINTDPYAPQVDLSKITFKHLPALITLEGERVVPLEDEDEVQVVEKGAKEGNSPLVIKAMVIHKLDTEKRIVYGWASVIEKDGEEVVDYEGDVISESELENAAHDFVRNVRMGKVMHEGAFKTELVESLFFSKTLQAALGVDLGKVGWLVGFHVPDDATWAKVKSGELPMFSIGGRGERVAIEQE